jgi:hypothetical protein
MDNTHKETCRETLKRSTQIIESSSRVAALCVIIVHESEDRVHQMEVVSCGQEDILNDIRNRVGFQVLGEWPVGRDN